MRIPGELMVTAGLLAVHAVGITVPGRKVELSTSNIITNCIRIGDLRAETRPSYVLAGSSMTGRLDAGAAAAAAGVPFVNLGLDGCGPVEALDFLLESGLRPLTVFVEVNAAGSVAPENARAVAEAAGGKGYWVREAVPFLRYRERPVDLVYSRLHSRVKSGEDGGGAVELPAMEVAVADGGHDPIAAALLERVVRIRMLGARVILVMLPDQGREREREYRIARQVSASAGIPLLDLKPALDRQLVYTDSVHLAAESGARLAAALGTLVRKKEQP
jgi:hypothetical protein